MPGDGDIGAIAPLGLADRVEVRPVAGAGVKAVADQDGARTASHRDRDHSRRALGRGRESLRGFVGGGGTPLAINRVAPARVPLREAALLAAAVIGGAVGGGLTRRLRALGRLVRVAGSAGIGGLAGVIVRLPGRSSLLMGRETLRLHGGLADPVW